MSKLVIFLLVAVVGQSLADVTDGTTLIGAIVIHRHGDRTPISGTSSLSTDPDALEVASAPYGYGQLTNAGKNRAYQLGQTFRSRYGDLLSEQYNSSEIYIRSTDYTRAKMTILTALAALYPAYTGSWSEEVNWVPTPYTTVAPAYDFNLFNANCPTYIDGGESLLLADPESMDQYSDVLDIVSAHYDYAYNLTAMPVMTYMFYDIYACQESLGVALSDDIAAIMDDLKVVADAASDVYLGDENYIRLQAGVMLNEFFTQADALIAGTSTPPVRIYSAHDLNVYSFEAVSKITPRQGYPQYASAFSLELRQVDETGQYVVLPVYQPTPGADLVYPEVADCGQLCDYDTYKDLVSEYTLDEDTWRTECGFSLDLIDVSGVN